MSVADNIRNALRVQKGLLSRTSILILAGMLFGMGLGPRMTPELTERCLVFGAFGLFAFGLLELAATLWFQRRQAELVRVSRRMLDRRIERFGLQSRPARTAARGQIES